MSTLKEYGFDQSMINKFSSTTILNMVRAISTMVSLGVKEPREILRFYILGDPNNVDDVPNKYVQKINS
jgi:hypothetical protein